MRYLSRVDLEMIGLRIISAYKRLPAVTDAPLERVDIDYLMQSLLGLRIDYRHLSPYRDKLGLTSMSEIGIEVFPSAAAKEEDSFYMLDGKTILIEEDLIREGSNIGRRNYTVSHEGCHHILKRLFPRDYGVQTKNRTVHCYYRRKRSSYDWEEWQVETLAGIVLLPQECLTRNMVRFGLGSQMRLLNRVFAPVEYQRFVDMACFMGVSKMSLSIRMTQLGLIRRNDLTDPYALVRIEKDTEED